ncbi:MAG: Hpt domain-containing protein [Labilithrix sp.]|nr:Hpt domain-containing protein [Labilithrix sp.]MCW5812996.1 Hpt domain-containing protein [Labilithrix sp.]
MAWQRHRRIAQLLSEAGGESTELRSAASELHCLSGEASMLAFDGVADVARDAEAAARKGDRVRLRNLVEELRSEIEAVAEERAP